MTIRTPDDDIDKLDYYYPPFKENDWYEGQTYGGHTDFSVDWNRRRQNGAWLEDEGQPVLAAADGKVSLIEAAGGAVYIDHWNGRRRTESRHMGKVLVKLGQKVQRGDKIGEIGKVGISPGSGFVPSAHLHAVHWSKVNGVWTRVKQTYYGEPVEASVHNSDSMPRTWNPPGPVMIQGPPPRTTWESAYREAAKALEKSDEAREGWRGKAALLKEERDLATKAADELRVALTQARADLTACQNAAPVDCTGQLAAQRASLLAAIRNGVGALVDGLEAEG